MSKSCPVEMIAGEGTSYTVVVSNNDNTTANSVMVTDTLPAGALFNWTLQFPSPTHAQS